MIVFSVFIYTLRPTLRRGAAKLHTLKKSDGVV
jgi:hypothetical protein